MTSASLFLNCKRRSKAQDLGRCPAVSGIFLCLSCKSGIDYGKCSKQPVAMYNGYTPLVNTGTPEYLAKVLEYKTKAVVNLVSYGNVMPLFLMVTAAVVIGAAGFAYLHNQKKVDFYHSIPVRRQMLYLVYHVDGILILTVTYFIHLLVLMAAAAACGVSRQSLQVLCFLAFS